VPASPRVRRTFLAGSGYRAIALFVFLIMHFISSCAGPLVRELPSAVKEVVVLSEILDEIDVATMYSCYQPLINTGVGVYQISVLSIPFLILVWGLVLVSVILLFRQLRSMLLTEIDRSREIEWRSVGPRLLISLFVGWFLYWAVCWTCLAVHLISYGV
jgi:hypothetical protein